MNEWIYVYASKTRRWDNQIDISYVDIEYICTYYYVVDR